MLQFSLNIQQQRAVELAVREVCRFRHHNLLAVNARTNHVHAVMSAVCEPEPIIDALKAYATPKLRREGLMPVTIRPWARHGSTRYLWKEQEVDNAVAYVMYDQGEN
jgi:REP element-mobilizing transposase RayT